MGCGGSKKAKKGKEPPPMPPKIDKRVPRVSGILPPGAVPKIESKETPAPAPVVPEVKTEPQAVAEEPVRYQDEQVVNFPAGTTGGGVSVLHNLNTADNTSHLSTTNVPKSLRASVDPILQQRQQIRQTTRSQQVGVISQTQQGQSGVRRTVTVSSRVAAGYGSPTPAAPSPPPTPQGQGQGSDTVSVTGTNVVVTRGSDGQVRPTHRRQVHVEIPVPPGEGVSVTVRGNAPGDQEATSVTEKAPPAPASPQGSAAAEGTIRASRVTGASRKLQSGQQQTSPTPGLSPSPGGQAHLPPFMSKAQPGAASSPPEAGKTQPAGAPEAGSAEPPGAAGEKPTGDKLTADTLETKDPGAAGSPEGGVAGAAMPGSAKGPPGSGKTPGSGKAPGSGKLPGSKKEGKPDAAKTESPTADAAATSKNQIEGAIKAKAPHSKNKEDKDKDKDKDKKPVKAMVKPAQRMFTEEGRKGPKVNKRRPELDEYGRPIIQLESDQSLDMDQQQVPPRNSRSLAPHQLENMEEWNGRTGTLRRAWRNRPPYPVDPDWMKKKPPHDVIAAAVARQKRNREQRRPRASANIVITPPKEDNTATALAASDTRLRRSYLNRAGAGSGGAAGATVATAGQGGAGAAAVASADEDFGARPMGGRGAAGAIVASTGQDGPGGSGAAAIASTDEEFGGERPMARSTAVAADVGGAGTTAAAAAAASDAPPMPREDVRELETFGRERLQEDQAGLPVNVKQSVNIFPTEKERSRLPAVQAEAIRTVSEASATSRAYAGGSDGAFAGAEARTNSRREQEITFQPAPPPRKQPCLSKHYYGAGARATATSGHHGGQAGATAEARVEAPPPPPPPPPPEEPKTVKIQTVSEIEVPVPPSEAAPTAIVTPAQRTVMEQDVQEIRQSAYQTDVRQSRQRIEQEGPPAVVVTQPCPKRRRHVNSTGHVCTGCVGCLPP